MTDPIDDAIDALAASLQLAVMPEWKAEIRTQLEVVLRHGALVAEFPLPDEAEPAPVFGA